MTNQIKAKSYANLNSFPGTDFPQIKITSKHYPKMLKELYRPPKTLHCQGVLELLNKPCIAIVGTRKCTEYGEEITRQIIAELAAYDLCIVSGLARGIDTIAHKAALQNALPTIAVMGTGIDQIFPKQNIKLAQGIAKNGLLISEYPAGTPPLKYHFPERNRIISGLSIATVIVEAPEKSGALITADFALEQGRDIFTVPADIDRDSCSGNLKLLKSAAAQPISGAQDILDFISQTLESTKNFDDQTSRYKQSQHQQSQKQRSQYGIPGAQQMISKSQQQTQKPPYQQTINFKLSPTETIILDSLSKVRAYSIEQISKRTDIALNKLIHALSLLEINLLVRNQGGKYLRIR